ncbi:MAG: feruloyl-CoA synthase [Salaquimonas sp.]|nr:feruloyl-CoA synthase [Salaquimonas sp.]
MSAVKEKQRDWRAAPFREAAFWQPRITTRETADGTIYVEQQLTLPPYPDRITDVLVEQAIYTPDRTLFAERGEDGEWRKLSYAQAVENLRRLGQYLIDMGLSADAPLAILSGNSIDHALLSLAAVHVGIPCAAISPAYSLVSADFTRLKDVFATIRPGMVYAHDAEIFLPAIEAVAGEDTLRLFSKHAPMGKQAFAHAVATEPTDAVDRAHHAVTPDTIAKFLFTSGSTGTPKAVINTNRMISSNQIMVREVFAYFKQEPPVLLDWAPWHHTAGGNKLFYMAMFNGGTFYIDDGRPTPHDIVKTVRNLRDVQPNWYFNVPKGFEALIPHLEKDAALRKAFFSNLKMLWYAGASLTQHTWEALERLAVDETGTRIIIATGLGATETAPATLMCTWPQDRAGNVGVPGNGVTLKLVPMDGKYDARVKGPNITPGYWHAPELTQRAFDEEGFYKFGDALKFAEPGKAEAGFMFDGRTAENFKLDTGTWVATGALRTAFVDHFGDLVRDAAIAGADRPYLTALVFPNIEMLKELTGGTDVAAMCTDPAIRERFAALLKEMADKATGSSTLIRRILLVAEPPSMDAGEQTDKGSLNQRAVLRTRADLVEELYAGSGRVIGI